MTFKELYDSVVAVVRPQQPNNLIKSGRSMAIIESKSGNVYYGTSIDTNNELGMSAERAAIANMVTYSGEFDIAKVVIVSVDDNNNISVRMPSGDSRDLMLQLSEANKDTEILMDPENQKMVRLNKLLPLWWGEKMQ